MENNEDMIREQLLGRGIHDKKVLRAMREIDRADFVPLHLQQQAYQDRPLPIGDQQTISQPYIVAFMAQALQLSPEDRVLEVGTGCGYNAAVLSRLAKEVYSIEIIEGLARLAKENLKRGVYPNLHTSHGDGYAGWPQQAPFDAIVLTAAPAAIPESLKQQLVLGGRLLAPVGTGLQELVLLIKTSEDRFQEKTLLSVRFVPMTRKPLD